MSGTLRPLSRVMARELEEYEIDSVGGGMMPARTDWFCNRGDMWIHDETTYND